MKIRFFTIARTRENLGRIVFTLLVCALALPAARGQNTSKPGTDASGNAGGVGFSASPEATPKDVGLPLYPGARPHKDKTDDSSAVQLEMWGKLAGFKVVVLKFESDDPPQKLVAFYQEALTKYGKVVNCSEATRASNAQKPKADSDELDCENDEPKNGTVELKAGTKDEQHLVGVEPNGAGSLLHLVYVNSRGEKNGK